MNLMTKLMTATAGLMMMGMAGEAMAAGGFPQPSICTRACWGARAAKSTPTQMSALNRAVIHHTAGASDWNTTSQSTSASKVRAIQNLHMDVNGWADVGYHFLADKLGNRFEGRVNSIGSRPRGAHDGNNTNSFGFTLMGYCHSPYNHQPPLAARNAIYDLIAWKMPNGWSPYGGGSYSGRSNVGFLCGHRDVMATACPGDTFYPYIGTNLSSGEARNAVNSRITGGSTPPPPPPDPVGNDGIIVDNGTAGYAEVGAWASSASGGYYGTDSRWASAVNGANTATWTPAITQAGTYKVYVRYVAGSNRSPGAAYNVAHAGGTAAVTGINQQTNGSVWVQLGEWVFNAGSAGSVTLDSVASLNGGDAGAVVSADAVQFVLTAPLVEEYIVDNTDAGFTASSNWFPTTSMSGYYGSNYHARATGSVSDAATWSVTLPTSGSYTVYTRWTTGSNRATAAPYIVYHAGGTYTITANQQQNNGAWMSLGTFNFNAGTATRVALSCWTSSGDFVIADAVRFVKN